MFTTIKKSLHELLCKVLEGPFSDGENHCYFQPPADIQMKYPCIVYNYTNDFDDYADNVIYKSSKRYTVTIIDEDPDSKIPNKLKNYIRYCTSDRVFADDGLMHFVYTLYYDGPRIKEENNESYVKSANGWKK